MLLVHNELKCYHRRTVGKGNQEQKQKIRTGMDQQSYHLKYQLKIQNIIPAGYGGKLLETTNTCLPNVLLIAKTHFFSSPTH
ncbi:hypothetical protein AQUCO_04500058v1 [Aquilegia coerulea]|uniref:Uncharacterized protein n=1 Tax=Aquilegia coerulea TaxID=218851 RepID=A0A2G5CLN3_AQUCA|nr:hypothetical protein AQUCO_04500058v1 [Aquilegia coerulea]